MCSEPRRSGQPRRTYRDGRVQSSEGHASSSMEAPAKGRCSRSAWTECWRLDRGNHAFEQILFKCREGGSGREDVALGTPLGLKLKHYRHPGRSCEAGSAGKLKRLPQRKATVTRARGRPRSPRGSRSICFGVIDRTCSAVVTDEPRSTVLHPASRQAQDRLTDSRCQPMPGGDKLFQCRVGAAIVQPATPIFDVSTMRRNSLRQSKLRVQFPPRLHSLWCNWFIRQGLA